MEVLTFMTEATQKLIHEAYVKAVSSNKGKPNINVVDVNENLVANIEQMYREGAFPVEDIPVIDLFLDKVSRGIRARKLTLPATTLCTELLHTTMYIVAWCNEKIKEENKKNLADFKARNVLTNFKARERLDVAMVARRKSGESEDAKQLELSDKLCVSQIMDRFGIRFILMNPVDGINRSCFLANKVLNIICSLNRKERSDFLEYVNKLDELNQLRIRYLLNIPFIIEPITRTDDPNDFKPSEHPDIDLPTEEDRKLVEHFNGNMKFYFDPKKNGYQSIHFVLGIENNSDVMPGFQIELQFRTWKMHKFAENDIKASHDAHKEGVADYTAIFHLSNEELANANILGFNSYKDPENDLDGIHFAKVFYNRRINSVSFRL